ncbi:MAG: class I SAM-dependent methyltransferase [Candidatus Levybacteria bacterium]|nr:class I SAM-dependent methyltransferase [Candidatus Levybacteria bacterium]
MINIYKKIKKKNSIWKFGLLRPYLVDGERILDFGCGDMELSRQIASRYKKTQITGVDVIPLMRKPTNKKLEFVQYDGKKLPFKDEFFDTTIAFYVLHHCDNPQAIIRECVRVSKGRVIIVESIPHSKLEIPFMRFFDWFFNILKFDNTPLPYNFKTIKQWKNVFQKFGLKNTISYHPAGYEDLLPFGKMYILEFAK